MHRFINTLPLVVCLSWFCASTPLQAEKLREAQAVGATKLVWTSAQHESSHHLGYSAKALLLGKAIPIELSFYSDTTDSKDVHGTLGFNLYLGKIGQLKLLEFEAFEGLDAVSAEKKPGLARHEMRVRWKRYRFARAQVLTRRFGVIARWRNHPRDDQMASW